MLSPYDKLEDKDIDELLDLMNASCVILDRSALSQEQLEDIADEADLSVAECVAVMLTFAKRKMEQQ